MGRDRRLIDSAGNEAKATTSGNRLQVRADFESTNDLDDIDTVLDNIQTLLEGTQLTKIWDGTDTLLIDASGQIAISNAFATEATLATIDGVLDNIQTLLEGTQITKVWDGTNYMPMMDAAARAGFVKVTDGTDVFDILGQTDLCGTTKGISVLGRRIEGTDTWYNIPVALNSDSVASKGTQIIPVTPMTGGREEGTFTRGFIPEDVLQPADSSATVSNETWTSVKSVTVSSGKTGYFTDFVAQHGGAAAGIEFQAQIKVGTTLVWQQRIAAGHSLDEHFHTPIKQTAGNTVSISIFQWSGGDQTFRANILGFETVDSELD